MRAVTNTKILNVLKECRSEIPKTIGMGRHTNPTWKELDDLIKDLSSAPKLKINEKKILKAIKEVA